MIVYLTKIIWILAMTVFFSASLRRGIIVAMLVSALALMQSGCGTYVPSTRVFPEDDDLGETDMVVAVVRSLSCELSYTVTSILKKDLEQSRFRRNETRYTDFLRNWGVQVAINLTVAERSAFNPTLLLTPLPAPNYVFTAAGGLTVSSEATRIDKMNVFFTIEDLYKPKFFSGENSTRAACRHPLGEKEGSPLVDTNLRLASLIEGRLAVDKFKIGSSIADSAYLAGDENVLSKTVNFRILASGGINPAWKLVDASVNSSGQLFSTGRDSTHELVFTFGPLDRSAVGRRSLIPLAELTHLNQQLQTGISNSSFFSSSMR